MVPTFYPSLHIPSFSHMNLCYIWKKATDVAADTIFLTVAYYNLPTGK